MILAIDVGNTNIVIGGIDSLGGICFSGRLATDKSKTGDEFAAAFKNIIELKGIDPKSLKGGIISSVVPPINTALSEAVEAVIGSTPMFIGPGVKTGLNILIDNPAQLGSDLAVDAVAALNQYQKPLIIIDMGTATTISAVDINGNYLGGVIYPGLKISQEALTGRTSQLQSISLEPPPKAIGRNTIDCMKSGAVYGNAAMLDGMIDRISDELEGTPTVIATGGLAKSVVPYCRNKIIYDDLLLLKGLFIIYQKNSK